MKNTLVLLVSVVLMINVIFIDGHAIPRNINDVKAVSLYKRADRGQVTEYQESDSDSTEEFSYEAGHSSSAAPVSPSGEEIMLQITVPSTQENPISPQDALLKAYLEHLAEGTYIPGIELQQVENLLREQRFQPDKLRAEARNFKASLSNSFKQKSTYEGPQNQSEEMKNIARGFLEEILKVKKEQNPLEVRVNGGMESSIIKRAEFESNELFYTKIGETMREYAGRASSSQGESYQVINYDSSKGWW